MKKVLISVITCRRPLWLKRLLEALQKQDVDSSISASILVVDNALDADTEKVVTDLSNEGVNIPVTYDEEPIPGIVAARNKCVDVFLNSDNDFLIFIDDDEWPQSADWINKLVNAVDEHKVDIVTSHVISVGEPGTPEWAIDLIYGRNPYQPNDFIDVFYTNNLLLSRNVIQSLIPVFDSRFAMTGASDYHFALRCKHKGFKCIYIDSPVEEEFPKSRATVKWFSRRGFRSGIGYTRSHLFEEKLYNAISRCIAMAGVRFLRGIFYLLLGALSFNKTKFVDGIFRVCSAYGTIAGFFGVKHEEYKTIHGK